MFKGSSINILKISGKAVQSDFKNKTVVKKYEYLLLIVMTIAIHFLNTILPVDLTFQKMKKKHSKNKNTNIQCKHT